MNQPLDHVPTISSRPIRDRLLLAMLAVDIFINIVVIGVIATRQL